MYWVFMNERDEMVRPVVEGALTTALGTNPSLGELLLSLSLSFSVILKFPTQ